MNNGSMTRLDARDSIPPAYTKLDTLKAFFATGLTSTDDKHALLNGLSLTRELFQSIYTVTVNIYTALQNSSYGQDFTPAMLTSFEDQVYTYSTKTKTSLTSI
jgi:hypothetical protein